MYQVIRKKKSTGKIIAILSFGDSFYRSASSS